MKSDNTYYTAYNEHNDYELPLHRRLINAIREGRLRISLHNFVENNYKYLKQVIRFTLVHRYFIYNNVKLKYSKKRYNSLDSERVIEIPIAEYFLRHSCGSCLEVGNVLNHYFYFDHDVVDLYETGDNIKNEDIATTKFDKQYDTIVSISTLEHVGFDEETKEVGKIKKSIDNMMTALKPKGRFLITMPLKYNPEADELVRANPYHFTLTVFERYSQNLWRETHENVLGLDFCDFTHHRTDLLVVLEYEKVN